MTPAPIWMPVGTTVFELDDCEPACSRFWYSRSSNSARPFLKPTVFMLAMLFEITSTLSCWAAMPVAAVRNAIMVRVPYWTEPSCCTAVAVRSAVLDSIWLTIS